MCSTISGTMLTESQMGQSQIDLTKSTQLFFYFINEFCLF